MPNHKTLYLAGFHDSWNKRAKLKAFSGIPPGAPVVLLAHNPDNFGEAIGAKVQVKIFGAMRPVVIPKYQEVPAFIIVKTT